MDSAFVSKVGATTTALNQFVSTIAMETDFALLASALAPRDSVEMTAPTFLAPTTALVMVIVSMAIANASAVTLWDHSRTVRRRAVPRVFTESASMENASVDQGGRDLIVQLLGAPMIAPATGVARMESANANLVGCRMTVEPRSAQLDLIRMDSPPCALDMDCVTKRLSVSVTLVGCRMIAQSNFVPMTVPAMVFAKQEFACALLDTLARTAPSLPASTAVPDADIARMALVPVKMVGVELIAPPRSAQATALATGSVRRWMVACALMVGREPIARLPAVLVDVPMESA